MDDKLKPILKLLVDMSEQYVGDHVRGDIGTSAAAAAVRLLAEHGIVRIEREFGRRVFANWTDAGRALLEDSGDLDSGTKIAPDGSTRARFTGTGQMDEAQLKAMKVLVGMVYQYCHNRGVISNRPAFPADAPAIRHLAKISLVEIDGEDESRLRARWSEAGRALFFAD